MPNNKPPADFGRRAAVLFTAMDQVSDSTGAALGAKPAYPSFFCCFCLASNSLRET